MTNQQLYLAIGLPILIKLLTTGLIMLHINVKLLRVQQLIYARLKHLEEK